jgi:prepilin-type N-terminal cleavage/methylation domain-containing protein
MKHKGFTLVEILITTIIFAILSTMTYSVINNSLKSEKIQKKHSENLTQLQHTLNFISRDMTQIFTKDFELNEYSFIFNSLQNDELLKLAYSVNEGQLIRKDITDKEASIDLILISEIEKSSIRLLDVKNKWHTQWKKINNNELKAIEIKFEHPSWGKIIKLVAIQ